MLFVDLEGANSGCIVDRCVLEPTDLFAAFSSEGQKLNIHLNVMSWHLLLIAFVCSLRILLNLSTLPLVWGDLGCI